MSDQQNHEPFPAELVPERRVDSPAGLEWQNITVSPAPKKAIPPIEVTPKLVFDALRNGALGGLMVGSWASIAFDLPYWETAIYSSFGGSMVFVLLTAGVTLSARSRSIFATLLRLLHGIMVTAFVLAMLGMVGLYIYVKTAPRPNPEREFNPPHATFSR